jgi:hypothetical protein
VEYENRWEMPVDEKGWKTVNRFPPFSSTLEIDQTD